MSYKFISSFNPFTDNQSQDYLAIHFPKGRLTAKRFDPLSIIWKLIYCLADFIKQITTQLFQLVYNLDIFQTDVLLPDWEKSMGVPGVISRITDVNGNPATVIQRQIAVNQLKSKIPVYNIQNNSYENNTKLSPFAGNIKTTIENYVFNLTAYNIAITLTQYGGYYYWAINVIGYNNILFPILQNDNTFPMNFPFEFDTPELTPQARYAIVTALERCIPSFISYDLNVYLNYQS